MATRIHRDQFPNFKGGGKLMTPEMFWEAFWGYYEQVKDKPYRVDDWVGAMATQVTRKKEKPLTMTGFEIYLFENNYCYKIHRYRSNKDGKYNEFQDVLRTIELMIKDDQISGAAAGVYNANIVSRLNGLTEKVDQKTEITEIKVKYERKNDNTESTTYGTAENSDGSEEV